MAEDTSTLRPTRGRAKLAAPPGLASAAIFERQVLVFPLLVVVLACASFLFGGTCAAWQWWTAVVAVVAAPFVRKDRRRSALGAAGLFVLLLFTLRCLIPPLVWDDTTCPDMPVYHLPMVQLLIEGWNPVADPMAEQITASLGLDLWGMAPLHVAFLPKTAAVFSAVAYTFVRDPYALTFPLPLFLWLGVFLAGIRMFRGFARWAVAAAFVFVLPMVAWRMFADLALAFASCGLLFAMQDALRRKKCDWLALGVWAAWMMNLKLNGVLGAFVFCAVFAAATIWKNRTEWKKWLARFAAFGCILVALWGLVSWNPLGTSWRTYGHPLYPFKTIDAERFPVKDLTWDLQGGNEDYQTMGRAGLLAHSYLAPRTTIAFYRWKQRRNDFEPFCVWWGWKEMADGRARVGVWVAFVILLLLPAGRLWALGGLVLLVLVPKNMIGFTRYQPWLSALGCLAAGLGAEWAESKLDERLSRALSVFVFCGLCLTAMVSGWDCTRTIEYKAKECSVTRRRIRAPFWRGPVELRKQLARIVPHFTPRYDYRTCFETRTKLLVRELGLNDKTEVEPSNEIIRAFRLDLDWDERNWGPNPKPGIATSASEPAIAPLENGAAGTDDEDEKETWMLSPFGYWVPNDEDAEHFVEFLAWTNRRNDEEARTERIRKTKTFFRVWFSTYPRQVLQRL